MSQDLLPPGLVAVRIEVDGACARLPIGREDTPATVNARLARIAQTLAGFTRNGKRFIGG